MKEYNIFVNQNMLDFEKLPKDGRIETSKEFSTLFEMSSLSKETVI